MCLMSLFLFLVYQKQFAQHKTQTLVLWVTFKILSESSTSAMCLRLMNSSSTFMSLNVSRSQAALRLPSTAPAGDVFIVSTVSVTMSCSNECALMHPQGRQKLSRSPCSLAYEEVQLRDP